MDSVRVGGTTFRLGDNTASSLARVAAGLRCTGSVKASRRLLALALCVDAGAISPETAMARAEPILFAV